MVASATDALSESVHGMALALYGFLFGLRELFWMNFGSSGGPLASILRAQGSQKWSLGRFGVHFEYPKASKSGLWGARGFFLDRWRLQGGLQVENTTFFFQFGFMVGVFWSKTAYTNQSRNLVDFLIEVGTPFGTMLRPSTLENEALVYTKRSFS